jgi:hypothetical protein
LGKRRHGQGVIVSPIERNGAVAQRSLLDKKDVPGLSGKNYGSLDGKVNPGFHSCFKKLNE